MTEIKSTQMLGHHYGRVPNDPRVVADIRRAHLRGFNTIVSSEYATLTEAGLGPDQVARVLPVAPRDAFAPPSLV